MLAALALASLLWPALSAHAQACTYQLSPDRITYGPVFATAVAGERLLGTRTTTLTVTCPTARDLTLEYIDQLPDTVALHWDLQSKGRFNVRMSNAMVDGAAVDLSGVGGAEAATIASAQTLAPDRDVTPFRNGNPVQGSTLTARIDVTAWLDQGVAVGGDTTWSGNGRLRFALSGDERPLTVEARMVPGACNINVDDVVLEDTPRSAFHPTLAIPRPESFESQVEVLCAAPGLIGITVTDNRADSTYLIDGAPETAARSFGLGKTTQNNKIGAYQIRLTESLGANLQYGEGSNATGWRILPRSEYYITHTPGRILTLVDGTTSLPRPLDAFYFSYRIRPYLAPASVANITGPEVFDGSATFTIVYL